MLKIMSKIRSSLPVHPKISDLHWYSTFKKSHCGTIVSVFYTATSWYFNENDSKMLASQSSLLSGLHAIHSSSLPLPSTQSISLWVSVSELWEVWQHVCHFISDLPPTLFSILFPFSSLAHLLAVFRCPLLCPIPLFLTLSLFLPDLLPPPLFSAA